MTQKQNDSECSSKCFNPRNPFGSHPSLSFIDISGSSPVNLSNAGRNSLRKRLENSNPITEKLVQMDPMSIFFPPDRLGQLRKQSNILIEGLETILKYLEPDFKPSIGSTRSQQNNSNEITSAGDIDRNVIESPALWTQPNQKGCNRTPPIAEHTVRSKQENKSDMLKEKLHELLNCALKIKNAIPTEPQYPHSGTANTLHMPTGAIMTPSTQTEPVNTYVKFLQIIDEAAGFSSERTDNRLRSWTQKQDSQRHTRMRINRTRTVDSAGHQRKSSRTNTDRRSSNCSLDKVLNETLNRTLIPNLSRNRKLPNLDVTVSEVMSDHTVDEGTDKRFPETQPYVSSLNRRSSKIPKMPSADAITITRPNEKHFVLTDYISALKQVNNRSPDTKRIREFSIRSKTYFDFDDYYEKLVNMHNNYRMFTDSTIPTINSYQSNSSHLKQL